MYVCDLNLRTKCMGSMNTGMGYYLYYALTYIRSMNTGILLCSSPSTLNMHMEIRIRRNVVFLAAQLIRDCGTI